MWHNVNSYLATLQPEPCRSCNNTCLFTCAAARTLRKTVHNACFQAKILFDAHQLAHLLACMLRPFKLMLRSLLGFLLRPSMAYRTPNIARSVVIGAEERDIVSHASEAAGREVAAAGGAAADAAE